MTVDVDDRTLAAWAVCGFADHPPKRCAVSAEVISRRLSNPVALPTPRWTQRFSAGPLHATVVAGPWIPFCDVWELTPWFTMWKRHLNMWQVVGLESDGQATKAHWGRLFTDIDTAAKAAVAPPLLFCGVAPGCAKWYERRLGFTRFAEIEEWAFAGGRPAVAMMRVYGNLVGDGERVARWNGGARE